MDDSMIVDLFLSRDEAAIAEASQKYGGALRTIAKRLTGDGQTAEECENDAYMKAWELIPPHEPREYLFPFLGKIVRGIAIDRCRRSLAMKRTGSYCELTKELEECIPSGASVEQEIEAGELKDLIEGFLDSLPEKKRNVFVRRYWHFEPVADIARAEGMTVSAVKTALHRMREQLKNELGKEGYTV